MISASALNAALNDPLPRLLVPCKAVNLLATPWLGGVMSWSLNPKVMGLNPTRIEKKFHFANVRGPVLIDIYTVSIYIYINKISKS